MTPNKEKELRKHLKTLDKDQLIELLLQFKCDAELLQGLANDTLDAMNEKLVLEKALELACEFLCGLCVWGKLEYNKAIKENVHYFIEQAKESLKNEKN